MSSIFSFLRGREEPPGEEQPVESTPTEPPAEPALVAAPTPTAPRAVVARALTANSASTPDQALDNMVAALLAVLEKCPLDLPEPGVSVTSVTERAIAVGNRRAFMPQAIQYFLRQNYPNRELVVVDDGTDAVTDMMPPDPQIRYVRLEGKHTLGTKRNLACEEARGEIIVHWDGDDWIYSCHLQWVAHEERE